MLKSNVLLLNASYEPLRIVSLERAICLQYTRKATVEEYNEDKVIRSPKEVWRVPSVIRLIEYRRGIRSSQKNASMKKGRIHIRDKWKCGYCGKKFNEKSLTLDHIIPKAQGGLNTPNNLVSCCVKCNQAKGNRTPDQANMPLIHSPRHLETRLDKAIMNHYGDNNPIWRKYMFLEDAGLAHQ